MSNQFVEVINTIKNVLLVTHPTVGDLVTYSMAGHLTPKRFYVYSTLIKYYNDEQYKHIKPQNLISRKAQKVHNSHSKNRVQ